MAQSRRTFLKAAGMAGAALVSGPAGVRKAFTQAGVSTEAQSIQTPALTIGYQDNGDKQGFPILLLHGFPDDVRAWDEVVPPLAQKGYRVIVPYLRGHGATRFRNPSAPRLAEQAAIGQDVIDLADAMHLTRFAVAGYDWGG